MKIVLLTLALVMAALGWTMYQFIPCAWTANPPPDAPGIELRISEGWSTTQIAFMLEQKGIISSALGYRIFSYIDNAARRGKPGSYTLKPGMSYQCIAQLLAAGPVRPEADLRVLEGWDISDIANLLEAQGVDQRLIEASVGTRGIGHAMDPDWRGRYPFLADLPRGATLEGYLFPDTYRVFKDLLPDGLVRKQLDAFAERAPRLEAEAKKQGKTLHQIVTMASILEKEARPADRRVIAGIFWNRIRIGMPLQSDATVNYVTRGGRARPTFDDLAADSPYNTYKVKGLPPGPISMPGDDALEAALFPAKTDYLFFLNDGDGKTYFARTYEEHQANRAKAYGGQ